MTTSKSYRIALLTAPLGLALASTVEAAPVIVFDDFSTGPSSASVNLLTSAATPASLLPNGYERVTAIAATALHTPGFDRVESAVFTGGLGFYDYASSSGADGFATLAYAKTLAAPAIPVDASYFLVLDFLFLDNANAGTTTVTATIGGGPDPVIVLPASAMATPGPQTLSIPLTGATFPAGFSNLSITIDTPQGGDFRLNSVSLVIPEPATLGLLAPAALLLARRRRA